MSTEIHLVIPKHPAKGNLRDETKRSNSVLEGDGDRSAGSPSQGWEHALLGGNMRCFSMAGISQFTMAVSPTV